MNIYLVRNTIGDAIWIAHEDDEMRIWSYVPNTGKFHLNQGLYLDFFFEHKNTYEPITVAAAQQAIRDDIGKLDGRTLSHLIDRFQTDPSARTVEDVLGATPIPTTRQQASARARALAAAPAGQWMTWKSYPRERKQLAHVAVTDIRSGKVRALRELGKVDVRLEDVDDQVQVLVARAS